MATLDALRAAVLPGARWLAAGPDVAPSTATSLDLGWVRLLRSRVPAFDALEPRDLAIVPRAAIRAIAPEADEIVAVVHAWVDTGIGGVVLVGDDVGVDGPILAVAAAAGLPVLDAGTEDAGALERSTIGFLVNDRAELERQATILETRLEQVALA